MEETATEHSILVVQPNQEHLHLIEQAFAENALSYQMFTVRDGHQAIDFLHRRGAYENVPRPDLILLELDLPEKDGREVLFQVKSSPQFRRIPIIVLTASSQTEDIFRSYFLQGNCYIIKSENATQLSHILKRIKEFWFGIVTLPVE